MQALVHTLGDSTLDNVYWSEIVIEKCMAGDNLHFHRVMQAHAILLRT